MKEKKILVKKTNTLLPRPRPDFRGGVPGMTEPEPRFGETFGFALFCQGSVSFARFLPSFAPFRPFFAPFLPENACFLPVFARFCPVSPGSFGFVQIHQDSFGFVPSLFAWFRPSLGRTPKNFQYIVFFSAWRAWWGGPQLKI